MSPENFSGFQKIGKWQVRKNGVGLGEVVKLALFSELLKVSLLLFERTESDSILIYNVNSQGIGTTNMMKNTNQYFCSISSKEIREFQAINDSRNTS